MSGSEIWQAPEGGPVGGPVAALRVRRLQRPGHQCGANLRVTLIPLAETKS